jgi:hypothetical protein
VVDLPYEVSAQYVPVPDAFEPNDVPGDARSITLGAPIQASLLSGLRDANLANIGLRSTDYYLVRLTAGMRVRMRLTNLPLSITPEVAFQCRTCSQPEGTRIQSSPGQDVDLLHVNAISATDDYLVRVRNVDSDPEERGQLYSALPPHFSAPYTLTVTQE